MIRMQPFTISLHNILIDEHHNERTETKAMWFCSHKKTQPDTMLFADNQVLLVTSEDDIQRSIYNLYTFTKLWTDQSLLWKQSM